MKKELKFKLGYSLSETAELTEYFDAEVPGNCQYDYAKAHNFPPIANGLNCRDYKWMEDAFWVYRTELDFSLEDNQKAFLCFDAIDYSYEIYINDELKVKDEGMFAPIRLDVSNYSSKKATLKVKILPAPKCDDSNCRDQASKSFKPCVCYGWDYHPRVISMGIWQDAYLEVLPSVCVENVETSYRLSDDFNTVTVLANAKVGVDCAVVFEVLYDTKTVAVATVNAVDKNASAEITVVNPKLWNPVGYGEQHLYTLKAKTLVDGKVVHEKSRKLGFRRSKLVMNAGAWDMPSDFPKGRSTAPATLEINGRRIFAKGTNWVNTDIFIGRTTEEDIRKLLTLIRDANMNIIRVHGGGPINKPCFYDICDEYGIMVWQEFPLACNEYPDDDGLLAVIEKEATSIICALRTHPCLVMWCGGNELFNGWSRMTEQHHVLRLLGSLCYQHDRFTPFNMTSPLYGMSHGHYVNYDETTGREVITDFINSKNTAYTEFGSPSMADINYLRTFMSEEDINDCNPKNPVWKEHHGFDSWIEDSWVRIPEVEYYFGGYDGIEDLCNKTRFIQTISYRALFEEMRKQWPVCSMAINWCFNEPWQTVANNSLVSYPDVVKPAYYAVQKALRPRLASLRTRRNLWWEDEIFRSEVWVLNDAITPIDGGKITVYYTMGDEEYRRWGTLEYGKVDAQSNLSLGEINFKILPSKNVCVKVLLKVENCPEMDSEYVYPIRLKEKKNFVKRLNF